MPSQDKSSLLSYQVLEALRHTFYFVVFFSVIINLLMLTVPIYMLQLFDRVLASQSYETLLFLTIIAVTALLVLGLIDMVRSRILIRVSHWLDNYLSPKALFKSADEILQGGLYGGQALRDIASIRGFLAGPSVFTFFDSPWVPIYLVIIYFLHPLLGVIATLGAIVLFILALLNELLTRQPLATANKLAIASNAYTDSALRNAEVIQAMGMMPSLVRRWFTENEKVLSLQTLASNKAGIILSFSKFMRMTLQLLILGVGALLVVENEITSGMMIAASILMSRALAPVEQAIGAWKNMVSAREAYKRLKVHLNAPVLRGAGIDLPEPKGYLTAENLYYVPRPGQRPIISGVSFAVKPGEIVGLIGPSAAGKTTLARLMVGAWKPSAGSVRLDGADVFTWDRDSFGKYVGYLPQDVELFNGTIKDNIARMGEADDQAVIAAAQLAGVHDLILHLPDGYDTQIGRGKYTLSGGQRQRIALARAVYKNPCLLVLDEPNSNLDRDGEMALLHALMKLKAAGSAIIVIGHRPSLIQQADNLVVLGRGTIQLQGPREHVLEQLRQLTNKQKPKGPIQKITYGVGSNDG